MLTGLAAAAGFAEPQDRWFVLESLRTGQTYGGFRFRDGETMQIERSQYRLQRLEGDRFLVLDSMRARRYGPYGFLHGRILDIAGEAFAVLRVEPPARLPPAATDPGGFLQPPRVLDDPWRDVSGDVGPFQPEGGLMGFWFEPWRQVPMNWKLGGRSGRREVDLESLSLGLMARFRGLEARAGRVMDAELGTSPVASGLMLTRLNIEEGSGWRIGGQYGLDWYREALIRMGTALQVEHSDLRFNLTSTAMIPVPGDENGNGTNGVATVTFRYETETSTLSLRETGVWGSVYLVLDAAVWGGAAEIRWLAYSDTRVDGAVRIGEDTVQLDAQRSHPLAVEIRVWRRHDPWIVELCGTLGAENRLRIQTGLFW